VRSNTSSALGIGFTVCTRANFSAVGAPKGLDAKVIWRFMSVVWVMYIPNEKKFILTVRLERYYAERLRKVGVIIFSTPFLLLL
jgi:hypothetical protein